jgi:hypothetical protein
MYEQRVLTAYDLPKDGSWINLSWAESQFEIVNPSDTVSRLPITEIPIPDRIDVCVFHAPCPDGTAAAFAVGKNFPECDFYGVNRGSGDTDLELPSGMEGKHVVLVDYVYSRDLMEQLATIAARVVVIDHHVSELQLLSDLASSYRNFSYLYSDKECAAVVVWRWLLPTESLPILYEYINDNDTGTRNLPNVSWFVSGFMGVASPVLDPGWSRWSDFEFFSDCLAGGKSFLLSKILTGVLARHIQWRDKNSDTQRCADKRLRVAPNFVCRVVNLPDSPSSGSVHKALLEGDFDGSPGAADISMHYYFVDWKAVWKCSLRSSADHVNVGLIASELGGGGHVHAASFTYTGPSIGDLFINEGDDDYWGWYG